MDAAAGECQTNAASVALKDSHAAKRANAETALLSAQQTRALQDARHRAEMAEADGRLYVDGAPERAQTREL